MQLDLNNLPTDTELLHRLVSDIAATIGNRDSEIERLRSIIKKLQRAQFGRRSERLDAVTTNDSEGSASVALIVVPALAARAIATARMREILPIQIAPSSICSKSLRIVFNGTKRDGQDPVWIIRSPVRLFFCSKLTSRRVIDTSVRCR
jgi:Transposase C of IS166 homeodomain